MAKAKLFQLLAALCVVVLVAAACSDDSADADGEVAPDGAEQVEIVQGSTLLAVQERGNLTCGVAGSAPGFSLAEEDGTVVGIDADYCRAVAAAVLGDANAVTFVAITEAERFDAVRAGQIDVLMRNTAWTQSRDAVVGVDFGPTIFYDGQQFMAREADGFSAGSTVEDIGDANVCTSAGTNQAAIIELAEDLGVSITVDTLEGFDSVTEQFISGDCDIITAGGSTLASSRAGQGPAGEGWVIFPSQPIGTAPLGPVYGQNDSQWADVINWTVYASFILGDQYGVTADNLESMETDGPPEVVRLLGGDGELQSEMGLSLDAFFNVVDQVGTYDEIFDRNLNPIGLEREGSLNASWLDGGLIYAPPAR